MSAQFIPLEDAAKKLGVSAQDMVEMRSRGDIFGYRDGASWKFKPEEIERVASEMMGGALDEDPAGSSILISEQDLGSVGSKHGSTIGSSLNLAEEGSDIDSDVALVPDPNSGSDVRLVAGKSSSKLADDDLRIAISDDDDDELSLESEDGDDLLAAASSGSGSPSDIKFGTSEESSIKIGSGTGGGSDIAVSGSDALDLDLAGDGSSVFSGSALGLGGSGSGAGSNSGSGPSDSGSFDLQLADDNDDLVLGGGSDLALGNDSGINLMSPADSGISLEDEPLDLAASGISGLDLAAESSDASGSGSGSAVGSGANFKQDEEFQLSPSGAIETDEDSGSQVIELEDSSEFGDAAVAIPAVDGFDAFGDVQNETGIGMGAELGGAPVSAGVTMGAPEIPYSLPQVLSLLGILLLMCMSGVLVTDVVRNMWAWSGTSDLTSGFTEMVLSAVGMKK